MFRTLHYVLHVPVVKLTSREPVNAPAVHHIVVVSNCLNCFHCDLQKTKVISIML